MDKIRFGEYFDPYNFDHIINADSVIFNGGSWLEEFNKLEQRDRAMWPIYAANLMALTWIETAKEEMGENIEKEKH
jgi:hypothetical protein